MRRLLVLFFCSALVFLTFVTEVNSEEIFFNDLLIPEDSSISESIEDNQLFIEEPNEEINIDDLLGPDIDFPFRPDNHRDSGTGKFNSF